MCMLLIKLQILLAIKKFLRHNPEDATKTEPFILVVFLYTKTNENNIPKIIIINILNFEPILFVL